MGKRGAKPWAGCHAGRFSENGWRYCMKPGDWEIDLQVTELCRTCFGKGYLTTAEAARLNAETGELVDCPDCEDGTATESVTIPVGVCRDHFRAIRQEPGGWSIDTEERQNSAGKRDDRARVFATPRVEVPA